MTLSVEELTRRLERAKKREEACVKQAEEACVKQAEAKTALAAQKQLDRRAKFEQIVAGREAGKSFFIIGVEYNGNYIYDSPVTR